MAVRREVGIICGLVLLLTASLAAQSGRNSINGRVTGPAGGGVEDARVVLKNQNLTDVAQDITDSLGTYRFTSVADGVYYIEVIPLGTGLEGRTLRVELFSLSRRPGGSADTYHFDFQLQSRREVEKPLPKALAQSLAFAQEVPSAARDKYRSAIKAIEKGKNEDAQALLRQAIETFPDYYDALDLLGSEYLDAKHFNVAVPLFLQAIDVNPKGWHSYYGLSIAYGNLKMRDKAIAAAKRSLDLNPVSARAHLQLGSELAKEKDSREMAVKSFQKAVELEPVIASDGYLALASLYSELGRYREAADALDKYIGTSTKPKEIAAIKEKIKELRKKAGPAN